MGQKSIQEIIVEQADKNELRLFHSQPMPRTYSTIARAKRLVSASTMQLALIDAVVPKKVK